MKTLIFEGIATSGKSTLIEKLRKELAAQHILVAGEPETHFPIMHQRDETHTAFFLSLIDTLVAKHPTILISIGST